MPAFDESSADAPSSGQAENSKGVPFSGAASSAPTARLTVLGSGTSMGVPTVGCECRVCRSTDPKDKRTRASILLSCAGHNILIDTTPDFRYQALRAGLKRLDAVVFTHGHADHILGLDDIRPFNLKQKAGLPVYAMPETLATLRRTFAYIFDDTAHLSTLPSVTLHAIEGPLHLFGLELIPIPAIHGEMKVLGFRFGRAAYLTDFSRLPDSSKELLRGLDDLILDALRYEPHPMHSSVAESLALVDELKPRRAWFTHICHDLPHEETNHRLALHPGPTEVRLSYDGLTFPVALDSPVASHQPPVALRLRSGQASRLRVLHSPEEWAAWAGTSAACVISVGIFDGMHLGHQKILERVVERARAGALAGTVTFDPHPALVLRPAEAPPLIATLAQRLARFEQMGLDAALVLRFDAALSRLSPEEFVRTILVEKLRVESVLVGENFRFGHQQAGDVRLLAELGQRMGFAVEVVPPVMVNGEIVSSTSIRRAIREGDVARAARLLGRPFLLSGQVRAGAGQGRSKLVPTLNLAYVQELLPKNGVYVTETHVAGTLYRSVTNVGVRPTLDGGSLVVESHLFDFSAQMTSGEMEILFHERLRDEQKFPSLDALRTQIHRDIAAAQAFFVSPTPRS